MVFGFSKCIDHFNYFFMASITKTIGKKSNLPNSVNKTKNSSIVFNNKSAATKNVIKHLLHPDYILFDWEFFSRELEFE
jgi:hypothetical protein